MDIYLIVHEQIRPSDGVSEGVSYEGASDSLGYIKSRVLEIAQGIGESYDQQGIVAHVDSSELEEKGECLVWLDRDITLANVLDEPFASDHYISIQSVPFDWSN